MERQRLINLSARMQQSEQKIPYLVVHICRNCNQSSSFSFNFKTEVPTKTCFKCGHVEEIKSQEAA